MCSTFGVRKLFSDRARLVVYVEAEDLNRLTAHARKEGRTVVEWARETLLGELNGASREDHAVRSARKPRSVRRGPDPHEHAIAVAQALDAGSNPECNPVAGRADAVDDVRRAKAKVCVHGRPQGFNCWQCGGIAKAEA